MSVLAQTHYSALNAPELEEMKEIIGWRKKLALFIQHPASDVGMITLVVLYILLVLILDALDPFYEKNRALEYAF